jgi:poly(rC)-binding protein 2/3/4
VQDALFHITSRIRESIFPMRNTPPNFSAPPHMPPFPETSPPLHRPRNHMMPSGHPHPPPPHVGPPPPPHVGPPMLPHGIDHPAGPPMHVDHPHAFSHGMGRGPPNMDRVPYPHGYEGPISPRSWNPQVSFTFSDVYVYIWSKHFSWRVELFNSFALTPSPCAHPLCIHTM